MMNGFNACMILRALSSWRRFCSVTLAVTFLSIDELTQRTVTCNRLLRQGKGPGVVVVVVVVVTVACFFS
jgi:hypothetical protein